MLLKELIAAYRTDKYSTFHKLRPDPRRNAFNLCERLIADCGDKTLAEINARYIRDVHEQWTGGGKKIAMGHALIGALRTVVNFGHVYGEFEGCDRLSAMLHGMRFANSRPRSERLTAAQADAIRHAAHERGQRSMALAQAFQFECTLRQKDVIGEWVDLSETGVSDVLDDGRKWHRGLRWEEIDALVLRHITSKRQKPIEVNLRLAPMVLKELEHHEALLQFRGDVCPTHGPVIVNEITGLPYTGDAFRRIWREIARSVGIPDVVKNMDTRSGAISEAIEAGASLEHVRHAAAHSNIAMTQKYDRTQATSTESTMQLRNAHRAKAA